MEKKPYKFLHKSGSEVKVGADELEKYMTEPGYKPASNETKEAFVAQQQEKKQKPLALVENSNGKKAKTEKQPEPQPDDQAKK